MILPRKFRDELGQDMVITKGVGKERCLYVFPQAEFEAFAAKLAQTIREEAPMHRLWYDLRIQATFDKALLPTVVDLDHQLEEMIWRVVSRYAELAETSAAVPSAAAYSVFDGLFENCLVRHLADDDTAADRLRDQAAWLLTRLMA